MPAQPRPVPGQDGLRWLIGLRLVVISTLFLGALIIQATTRQILPISTLYALFLASYCLSLVYLGMYLKGVPTGTQTAIQMLGDVAVVTGFVYVTGGVDSPFSFLYLTVICVSAVLLPRGGFVFAGVSAVVYGVLVDLMVFGMIPVPPNLVGTRTVIPTPRVLYQLLIHVVGFILVAFLVSYLSSSVRTARNRLEEERERASQFVALTDHVVRSVGAGILAADLEGRVLHVNPAGTRILGLADPESVVGLPLDEVMPLADHSWALVWTQTRTRSLTRLERRLGGPTGIRLGLSVGPLEDEASSVVGFVVNFQDLSEVEAQLEHQRLQDRMAAVGELASRMAHEIKNPLASISGSAQMLASLDDVDVTIGRLLHIVVDESQRLSGILDSFLDYARPRQSTQELCDLSAMLRDCVDLLERSPEIRDDHSVSLDASERTTIMGDERLLRQVFWNLSLNALQAMPEGGDLSIRLRRQAGSILLSWSDTGVGMDDETRRRAFEPFFTTSSSGTGLGLAVVYAAVQEHGGTIEVQSTLGQGTTISLDLPHHV
jgi:two-component system sensor histidine kinase PilS (NtrC family)